MDGREVLVASTSATFLHGGVRVQLKKGHTTIRQGHPLLRGREHMFEPITVTYDVPIEAASSGPRTARSKARSGR